MLGGFSGIMNIIYLEQYWINVSFFYYIVIFIIIIKWKSPWASALFIPYTCMLTYTNRHTHTHTHTHTHILSLTLLTSLRCSLGILRLNQA